MILNYKSQFQNTLENPYRIFFPIGIVGAIYGLSLVIFLSKSENIFWHKEIMITLFLFPIATGFILTALPRFLNSKFITIQEIFIFVLIYLSLFIFSFQSNVKLFVIFKFLLFSLINYFVIFRYLLKKAYPPIFFSFIFIFTILSIIAGILQIFISFKEMYQYYNIYSAIYYHGLFWILLFGVGVKFFPMLTLSVPIQNRKYNLLKNNLYASRTFWWVIGILFSLTFFLDGIGYSLIANILRMGFIVFFGYEAFYIFFPAQRKGYFTFFIKLFLYSIFLLPVILFFYEELRPHIYHILFINGFLGLVLIVVSRVIISHEKLDLNLEVKSRLFMFIFILIFIAMIIRVSAIFLENYQNYLIYASLTAILAVVSVSSYLLFLVIKKYKFYI